MVDGGSIAVALIGLLGVVVGGMLSWAVSKYEQNKQQERWYVDYYLQYKIESLIELHKKLTKAKRLIMIYKQKPPVASLDESDAMEIIESFEEYSEALDRASIFIEPSSNETFQEFYNVFLHMVQSSDDFSISAQSVNVSTTVIEEFLECYDDSLLSIQEELNEPITKIEIGE